MYTGILISLFAGLWMMLLSGKRSLTSLMVKIGFLLAYAQNSNRGMPLNTWGDNSHTALLEALNSHIGDYVFIGPDVHWPIAPDDYPGEWISGVLNAPSENSKDEK